MEIKGENSSIDNFFKKKENLQILSAKVISKKTIEKVNSFGNIYIGKNIGNQNKNADEEFKGDLNKIKSFKNNPPRKESYLKDFQLSDVPEFPSNKNLKFNLGKSIKINVKINKDEELKKNKLILKDECIHNKNIVNMPRNLNEPKNYEEKNEHKSHSFNSKIKNSKISNTNFESSNYLYIDIKGKNKINPNEKSNVNEENFYNKDKSNILNLNNTNTNLIKINQNIPTKEYKIDLSTEKVNESENKEEEMKHSTFCRRTLSKIYFELDKKFSLQGKLPKNGNLIRLIFHNILTILVFFGFLSGLVFVREVTKRPIICDTSAYWPKNTYYDTIDKNDINYLQDCSVLCDIKKGIFNLENNYVFARILRIPVFLIKLNMALTIPYFLSKKISWLFCLFAMIQLTIYLISYYFSFIQKRSYLLSFSWILCLFVTFSEGKPTLYLGLIVFVILIYIFGMILILQNFFTFLISKSLIFVIAFPIVQNVIIYFLNCLLEVKLAKYVPIQLKYHIYFFLNSSIEGFKIGFYYVNSEKSLVNFHFLMFLILDIFLYFSRKYKLFEICFNSFQKIKTQDKNKNNINEKLSDISNVECQLLSIIIMFVLINKNFFYFFQSTQYTDCFGNPNKKYFSPNSNAKILIIILLFKSILIIIFSNFIFKKLFKTDSYFLPSFTNYGENYMKISINFYSIIILNFYSLNYGLLFYKQYILDNQIELDYL